MFPKYPFIIHLSIVQRDMGSVQLSPSQGFVILFVQSRECWRQLATHCCGCSQGSPPRGWEEVSSGGSAIQVSSVALGQGGSSSFYPPTQVLFCVARQKPNNGHLLSPGGDKQKQSIKLAFENSSIELPATPRTWPESAFSQPQEAIVLFFKKLSAWKETTKRERDYLPKGS